MWQPGLIAWCLICYFCSVLAAETSDGPLRLQVTVHEEALQGVASCQHAFSQVELLNLHSTETIVIHSIQTAPEETSLIKSGEKTGESWEDDAIPKQLHISKFHQGSLTLGPNQLAIVPVTFFPRYPADSTHEYLYDALLSDAPPSSTFSATARVDLTELVGEHLLRDVNNKHRIVKAAPRRRNNLNHSSSFPSESIYEVSTTVLVETSNGVLKLPITASSYRTNEYGIPDVLHFAHDDHAESTESPGLSPKAHTVDHITATLEDARDAVLLDTHEAHSTGDGRQTQNHRDERDCVDVYISNSATATELEIAEVMVSRPDLMSVEFAPDQAMHHGGAMGQLVGPQQVLRDWTEDGSLYIPAHSDKKYAVTVCKAPGGVPSDSSIGSYLDEMSAWIDAGNPENNLGFLQIRTGKGFIFVALNNYERPSPTDTSTDLQNIDSLQANRTSPLLRATTDHVNFEFKSSSEEEIVVHVGLQNRSPAPINIMRLAVGLETPGDKFTQQQYNETLGLSMKVTTKDASSTIGAMETINDALTISCRISSDAATSLERDRYNFTGTVVARGTMDTELSYDAWKAEMMDDPFRERHLTVEIPFSVGISNGRIEVIVERSTHPYPQIFAQKHWNFSKRDVSALFFPLSAFQSPEGTELPLPTQHYDEKEDIGHVLRIVSNLASPVQVLSADVVDSNDDSTTSSLCHRFNVTLGKATSDETRQHGFSEDSSIALTYTFGRSSNRQEKGLRKKAGTIHPTVCYLKITTDSVDSGEHHTPLLIYPGEFEISTLAALEYQMSGSRETEIGTNQTDTTSILVGMSPLMSWFKTSLSGKVLLDQIVEVLQDKKQYRNRQHLISTYLRTISRRTESDIQQSRIKPILLKVGAVESGETAVAPLFLTNHNPIPISVVTEVAEVEGMSIVLARDENEDHGDGKSILDRLPLKTLSSQALITEGEKKGHPVNGLRHFLMSDEWAVSFLTRFRFKDSIALNQEATRRQPLLRALFQVHSRVDFHSEPFQMRKYPPGTACSSSDRPPRYLEQEWKMKSKKRKSLPGPLLVSSNRILAKPLHVCGDHETDQGTPSEHSNGSRVLVPPGATAKFEVRVRAPPKEVLGNDISELLSTGLVLSTSLGDVMPILTAFQALQGQLHIANTTAESDYTVQKASSADKIRVVHVPLVLSWPADDSSEKLPASPASRVDENQSTQFSQPALQMWVNSTFTRVVRLVEVESCNPWFSVSLPRNNESLALQPQSGAALGPVVSSALCASSSHKTTMFPSYYQCALKWLKERSHIQPPGCGLPLSFQKTRETDTDDLSFMTTEKLLNALEKALYTTQSSFSDFIASNSSEYYQSKKNPLSTKYSGLKTLSKKSEGTVTKANVLAYAEAWDAWRIAADKGLTKLSSNIRATIKYDSLPDERSVDDELIGAGGTLNLSLSKFAVESELLAPRLLDTDSARSNDGSLLTDIKGDIPGILEFPPTMVGTLSPVKIPLRNPTSVPVKVRLVVAPPTLGRDEGNENFSVDQEMLMTKYTQGLRPPYIQHRKGSEIQDTLQHDWWEGNGAFLLTDETGDTIRSSHNVTIRAGAGASISLVSPGLHAHVSFSVGCGTRCAVKGKSFMAGSEVDSSPIGAAAAAGVTLAGARRSSVPDDSPSNDEPFIYSGGIPRTGSDGPAAFAVPQSSMDEVVIPPYGVVELGPIFFRPPGQFGSLGCELVDQSDAHYPDTAAKKSNLCSSQFFESMVFLQNSLTGIERVALRGRSLWDRLLFLDPPLRPGGDDAFGDIEIRNGRSTLVFPGYGEYIEFPDRSSLWNEIAMPVVKEVILNNNGDVAVVVDAVYFSDTSKLSKKQWPSHGVPPEACSFQSFRLLDCWEDDEDLREINGRFVQNIHSGLVLQPGYNHSVLIQHVPECTKQEEFVALNVEYRHDLPGNSESSDSSILSMSRTREKRANHQGNAKKMELIVGYSMSAEELSDCSWIEKELEVPRYGLDTYVATRKLQGRRALNLTAIYSDHGDGKQSRDHELLDATSALFASFFLVACSVELVVLGFRLRHLTLASKYSLIPTPSDSEEAQAALVKRRASQNSLWNAAYRCLARADPTSTELSTLGREQIRQVIMARYRAKGGNLHPSLTSLDTFSRDRIGSVAGNLAKQRTGKEKTTGGSNNVRTLSDAIFFRLSLEESEVVRKLPLGLGWRAAYTRSMIDDRSIGACRIPLKWRTEKARRGGKRLAQAPSLTSLTDNIPVANGHHEEQTNNISTTSNIDHASEEDLAVEQEKATKLPATPPLKESTRVDVNRDSKLNRSDCKATVDEEKSRKQRDEPVTRNGGVKPVRKVDVGNQDKTKTTPKNSNTKNLDEDTASRKPAGRGKKGKKSDTERSKPQPSPTPTKVSEKDPGALVDELSLQDSTRKDNANGVLTPMDASPKRSPETETMVASPRPLRPPPGLAPPPGFGGSTTNGIAAADSSGLGPLLVPSLPTSDRSSPLTTGQESIQSSGVNSDEEISNSFVPQASRGNESNTFQSQSSSALGTGPQAALGYDDSIRLSPPNLQTLLEQPTNQAGFDVMDFLDSILDDSGPALAAQQQYQQQQLEGGGASAALALPEHPDMSGLLANPWAMDGKSRASAYGISFDDGDRLSRREGSPTASATAFPPEGSSSAIPLLTPSTLLMEAGRTNEPGSVDDAEEERVQSLYASFLLDQDDD